MNITIVDFKNFDDNGAEFWYARELKLALEYKEWRNFNKVIETAKIACNRKRRCQLCEQPQQAAY